MARPTPDSRHLATRIAGTGVSILAMAVVTLTAHITPANAAEPEPAAAPVAAVPAETDPLAGIDTEAVADAAQGFTSGNAADAAQLAEAAAATDAVPVERALQGMVAETDTGTVEISRDGEVAISTEGLPEIGIAVEGSPETVKIVDGAVVQTEVAPSTDVVTRATEEGVQMIAILGDEEAPTKIGFPLALPEGADLVERPDGSIAVFSDIEAEVPAEGEEERIAAAIDAVLVDDELDELSDEQIRLLKEIPDAKTVTGAVITQVALIEAPWAVDANGQALETRYEVEGDTLVQIIETDENTVFPVVADPGVLAGALKLGGCLVSVGSIFILPAAGIAKLAAKFLIGLKKAKGATTLVAAWNKLGTSTGTRLSTLLSQLRTAASLIKDKGISVAKRTMLSKKGKAAAAATLLWGGLNVAMDLVGLGDCYDFFTGNY